MQLAYAPEFWRCFGFPWLFLACNNEGPLRSPGDKPRDAMTPKETHERPKPLVFFCIWFLRGFSMFVMSCFHMFVWGFAWEIAMADPPLPHAVSICLGFLCFFVFPDVSCSLLNFPQGCACVFHSPVQLADALGSDCFFRFSLVFLSLFVALLKLCTGCP